MRRRQLAGAGTPHRLVGDAGDAWWNGGMETLPGLGRLPDVGDQGELLSVGAGPREIVGEVRNPVAHVHVELHQPHLDKVFDYLVPAAMDAAAVPAGHGNAP